MADFLQERQASAAPGEGFFPIDKLQWINRPKNFSVDGKEIRIRAEPDTDLWQRTYYHFRRNTAHMLVMPTEAPFFTFSVKTVRKGTGLFDQCGIVVYLDEENWFKGSMEYENERFQNLGSVVTNNGYSDFGTGAVDPALTAMYYRLSRRGGDFFLETSRTGGDYTPARIFHLFKGEGALRFGVYACSPSKGAGCEAVFTELSLGECLWKAWE
jgi:regulation of enolase protein 1 (concanavalin A-like superfamily)